MLASDLHAAGEPAAAAPGWRAAVRAGLESLLPRLLAVEFPHLVAGVYDVTPDHNPLVGPVPGADGVWVAAGFSGHGFMIAPAIGRLLAEAVAGGDPGGLPPELRADRFAGPPAARETQIV